MIIQIEKLHFPFHLYSYNTYLCGMKLQCYGKFTFEFLSLHNHLDKVSYGLLNCKLIFVMFPSSLVLFLFAVPGLPVLFFVFLGTLFSLFSKSTWRSFYLHYNT